jgi:hypothetical protein
MDFYGKTVVFENEKDPTLATSGIDVNETIFTNITNKYHTDTDTVSNILANANTYEAGLNAVIGESNEKIKGILTVITQQLNVTPVPDVTTYIIAQVASRQSLTVQLFQELVRFSFITSTYASVQDDIDFVTNNYTYILPAQNYAAIDDKYKPLVQQLGRKLNSLDYLIKKYNVVNLDKDAINNHVDDNIASLDVYKLCSSFTTIHTATPSEASDPLKQSLERLINIEGPTTGTSISADRFLFLAYISSLTKNDKFKYLEQIIQLFCFYKNEMIGGPARSNPSSPTTGMFDAAVKFFRTSRSNRQPTEIIQNNIIINLIYETLILLDNNGNNAYSCTLSDITFNDPGVVSAPAANPTDTTSVLLSVLNECDINMSSNASIVSVVSKTNPPIETDETHETPMDDTDDNGLITISDTISDTTTDVDMAELDNQYILVADYSSEQMSNKLISATIIIPQQQQLLRIVNSCNNEIRHANNPSTSRKRGLPPTPAQLQADAIARMITADQVRIDQATSDLYNLAMELQRENPFLEGGRKFNSEELSPLTVSSSSPTPTKSLPDLVPIEIVKVSDNPFINFGSHPLFPIYIILTTFSNSLGPKYENFCFFKLYIKYFNIIKKMANVIINNYLQKKTREHVLFAYLIGFALQSVLFSSNTNEAIYKEILSITSNNSRYSDFATINDVFSNAAFGTFYLSDSEIETNKQLINNDLFKNFFNTEVNIGQLLNEKLNIPEIIPGSTDDNVTYIELQREVDLLIKTVSVEIIRGASFNNNSSVSSTNSQTMSALTDTQPISSTDPTEVNTSLTDSKRIPINEIESSSTLIESRGGKYKTTRKNKKRSKNKKTNKNKKKTNKNKTNKNNKKTNKQKRKKNKMSRNNK